MYYERWGLIGRYRKWQCKQQHLVLWLYWKWSKPQLRICSYYSRGDRVCEETSRLYSTLQLEGDMNSSTSSLCRPGSLVSNTPVLVRTNICSKPTFHLVVGKPEPSNPSIFYKPASQPVSPSYSMLTKFSSIFLRTKKVASVTPAILYRLNSISSSCLLLTAAMWVNELLSPWFSCWIFEKRAFNLKGGSSLWVDIWMVMDFLAGWLDVLWKKGNQLSVKIKCEFL